MSVSSLRMYECMCECSLLGSFFLGSLLALRMLFLGAERGDLSQRESAVTSGPCSAHSPQSPESLFPRPGWAGVLFWSSSPGCIISVFKGFGPRSSPAQLNVLGSSEIEPLSLWCWLGEYSE